jgi:hypothetical protein
MRSLVRTGENWLYEQWKETGDKDLADSWLQAQQQLRLTAQELLKRPAASSDRSEPVKGTSGAPQSPAVLLAKAKAAAAAAKK